MLRLKTGLFFLILTLALPLSAGEGPASPSPGQDPVFGPYTAIRINQDVIRGVRVDEEDRIWIMLNPDYKERKLTLKISMEKGAAYRKWFNGEYELVSPANQGKQANEWTDWVRTESRYIEYWMEGQKVLHLKKAG